MTLLINLYGGPGPGKSTFAAALLSELKQRGVNAELVREYAKGWAWEGRKISPLDQFYVFGKQLRAEACLLGKVEVIVTDSPILLGCVYGDRYGAGDVADVLRQACEVYRARLADGGHEHEHYMLQRSKAYNPVGRNETEAQARELDGSIAVEAANQVGSLAVRPCNMQSVADIAGEVIARLAVTRPTQPAMFKVDLLRADAERVISNEDLWGPWNGGES